ncbi:MAG: GTP-binding protein [Asgard group archaeon]|nr:GTP-binding protein [Asgard group archaeon]
MWNQNEQQIEILLKQLKESDDIDLRCDAVEKLSLMEEYHERAVPALIEALKDENWMVRTEAAKALGRIGTKAKKSIPALKDAMNLPLNRPKKPVFFEAIRTLEEAPDYVPEVIPKVEVVEEKPIEEKVETFEEVILEEVIEEPVKEEPTEALAEEIVELEKKVDEIVETEPVEEIIDEPFVTEPTEEITPEIEEEKDEEEIGDDIVEIVEDVAEDITEETTEDEMIAEAIEEITEEVMEDVIEDVVDESVDEDIIEDIAEDITEEVLETVDEVTEEIDRVIEEVTEDLPETPTEEEIVEEVIEEVTEETIEETVEDITGETVDEETTEEVAKTGIEIKWEDKTEEEEEKKNEMTTESDQPTTELPTAEDVTVKKVTKVMLKAILAGEDVVGKTSLRESYCEAGFSYEYQEIIGADFGTKHFELNDESFIMQIWDIAAKDRFNFNKQLFFRGMIGAILIFDISRKETFEKINNWFSDIINIEGKHLAFILVGNKFDLRANEDLDCVSSEEGETLAKKLSEELGADVPYVETNALTGEGIERAFQLLEELTASLYFKINEN